MTQWLPLVPLLPLLSSAALLIGGRRMEERLAAALGVGSLFLAALLSAFIIGGFLRGGGEAFVVTLLPWLSLPELSVSFNLYFDGLTAVMVGVITGVGFLIHWYSTAYMAGEEGYARFFGYLNLFVGMMLLLVLAEEFLLLYLGWEGVGLCSFLLIGFWYRDPENGYAARKAFVVTRIGDVGLAIALLIMVQQFGTLQIGSVMDMAMRQWQGSEWATIVAVLLLLGAVGKSAQLPLQTWLPDAMAGPTPVSALIHAATMVTAGVYLIARSHELFLLSPEAMRLVALVGALTLFLAACSALVQTDLKRILAYSTISQIGYMFFALGVGAFSAGIFHLMTHAFFKALLFLAAGQIILSLHHEQDIRRMGGLRRSMPLIAVCFAVGSAALAALPLTSGFYSKDAILLQGFAGSGLTASWCLALAGAFVTALYSARMFLRVFFGDVVTTPEPDRRSAMLVPIVLLTLLAVGGGLISQPLESVFGTMREEHIAGGVHAVVLLMPWLGIAAGWWFWHRRVSVAQRPIPEAIAAWWYRGWGFDRVYELLLVRPLLALASLNRGDVLDRGVALIAVASRRGHGLLARTQNGRLRWYAAGIALGAVLTIAVVNT